MGSEPPNSQTRSLGDATSCCTTVSAGAGAAVAAAEREGAGAGAGTGSGSDSSSRSSSCLTDDTNGAGQGAVAEVVTAIATFAGAHPVEAWPMVSGRPRSTGVNTGGVKHADTTPRVTQRVT